MYICLTAKFTNYQVLIFSINLSAKKMIIKIILKLQFISLLKNEFFL